MDASQTFVHRFLGAADQSSAPTLLVLHGTGGDENILLRLGQTILPQANVLSPRGKVLENNMPRFFRRLAEGVFDLDDLRFRTNELTDFIQAASREYGFDPERVFAMGYSNGANIAASMLLLRPGILAGAVLLRAMVPLVPETLPDLNHVPVLIAAGQTDPIAPPSQTQALAELLQDSGANVQIAMQCAGHQLIEDDVESARTFLAAKTSLA